MINNDRLLVQILLVVLFGASFWVMAPFWSAMFWGAVLAFASWPLMRLLTRWLNGRESLAAALLTLGWMLLVALPLVWLGFNLADHVRDATAFIKDVQVDGKPLATSFQDRLFGPLGMTNTELPAAASFTIPDPFAHGYLYGSSSVALYGEPDYTPEQIAAAKDGSWQPTDYTDINHSFAFGAGNVISTTTDLVTWMDALAGGKVLDAEYQKLWLESPQLEDPDNPAGQSYGYGITRQSWGPNTIYFHGGETAGYNSKIISDIANGVTIALWTNLTVDVDKERQTANTLMLRILDQIYVTSPFTPSASTAATPTTAG